MPSTIPSSVVQYTSLKTSPVPKQRDRRKRPWKLWSRTDSVVDWRVPGVMFVCLLLGVVTAVGHHIFYRHWNGQSVDLASWSQQWISRGGTAFAFLVKLFLTVATGTAYTQQLWVMVQSRPVKVQKVDAMFGVLGNPLQFLDVRFWLRNLILAILAIITWLLPIAAISTPGTLNVITAQRLPVTELPVPQINFLNGTSFGYGSFGSFAAASDELFRLAITVASGASLLQIPFSLPNASYQLEFFAPAISCYEPSVVITKEFENYINTTIGNESRLYYLAFVPLGGNQSVTLQVTYGDLQSLQIPPTIDSNSPDATKIYVALDFDSWDSAFPPIVECSLKNASFTVDFDFSYPDQSLTVVKRKLLNDVSASDLPQTLTPPARWAYASVMQAFGQLLCGITWAGTLGSSQSYYTLYSITQLRSISGGYFAKPLDELVLTLEEMFQNVTFSLFSNEIFRKNATQAHDVKVTTAKFVTIYDYRPQDLYIAYGISILASVLCVAVGFVAIYRNKGSYTNSFSTIMRATRHDSLDDLVAVADTSGADPLGKKISEATVKMVLHPKKDKVMGFQSL